MTIDPPRLFVYGPWQSSAPRPTPHLPRAGRRSARVRGHLFTMKNGVPALASGPPSPDDDTWVHGELVPLTDPRVLVLLDHYRGVEDGLFARVVVPVIVGLTTTTAWVYTMERPAHRGGRHVPGGRWRPVRRRRDTR